MSEDNPLPDWPDETEAVDLSESSAVESIPVAELAAKVLDEDVEDRRYINVVDLLHKLPQGPAILALSDGVTNHYVTSTGFSVEGRIYWIYYQDPWGPKRGSFLQKGKNIAGVEARPVEGKPGAWAITHEEMMRVLDSSIVVDGAKKRRGDRSSES